MSEKQENLDKINKPYRDYISKLEKLLEKEKQEKEKYKEKAKREKSWANEERKILSSYINNEIDKCKWYMKRLELETEALLRACEICTYILPDGTKELHSAGGAVLDFETKKIKEVKPYLISKDIYKMRDYLLKQIEKEKKYGKKKSN